MYQVVGGEQFADGDAFGGAGRAHENAFWHHLRWMADQGALGPQVVAIGPWWTRDGNNEIDAVVIAEHDQQCVPVLVGECEWAMQIDGGRLKAGLIRKAASVPRGGEHLKYGVSTRDEIIHADIDTLTVTVADIFAA